MMRGSIVKIMGKKRESYETDYIYGIHESVPCAGMAA
jgi:hypothetical protein